MNKILINESQLEILTQHILIEQEIGDIIVINGKKYKITDLIEQNLPKTNIGQQFASGTYQLSDKSKTKTDALLKKMVAFFQLPELQNTTFDIKLEGGASQVPMGNTLSKTLGINLSLDKFIGRNQELAKKRAVAIQQLLINGLKSEGIKNVTIPEPTVIVGKTKWDKNKGAKHNDYTKEQFMNVSVEASGTKVVKEQLPDFCKKPFVPKKGGQASKSTGWKVYKGTGWEIDMGDGEGQITLKFDALQLPDMFEILYNGEVYRSKNPDTKEQGFVSSKFTKLTTEQLGQVKVDKEEKKKSLEKIESDIKKYGYDRPVNMGKWGKKNLIRYWFPLSDRVINNYNWEEKGETETYPLDANNQADLQWFQDFYKKFPTEKDFRKFKGEGVDVRKGDGGRKASGLSKKQVRALWSFIARMYKVVQVRPKKIKKQMNSLKENILKDNVAIAYNEKYGGNYSAFIKDMDKKIKAAGFSEGIVGPNGQITFNKISGENKMSLQVYAPIGGTLWNAQVGCKASTATT